jgi:hypothetical protein
LISEWAQFCVKMVQMDKQFTSPLWSLDNAEFNKFLWLRINLSALHLNRPNMGRLLTCMGMWFAKFLTYSCASLQKNPHFRWDLTTKSWLLDWLLNCYLRSPFHKCGLWFILLAPGTTFTCTTVCLGFCLD